MRSRQSGPERVLGRGRHEWRPWTLAEVCLDRWAQESKDARTVLGTGGDRRPDPLAPADEIDKNQFFSRERLRKTVPGTFPLGHLGYRNPMRRRGRRSERTVEAQPSARFLSSEPNQGAHAVPRIARIARIARIE